MKKTIFSILIMLSLYACDIKDNEIEPGYGFTRIYDQPTFSGDIHPLSVVQIEDSGYLILAAKDSWQVYLMKIKENGDQAWEKTLAEPFVNPLAGIIHQGDSYFIACMDEVSLGTYLLKIDLQGNEPSREASFPNITYPLSFSQTSEEGFLIQGYDRTARSTTISKISSTLTLEWQQKYDVLEDKEELLIKHLTRTGQRLPFYTGFKTGNGNQGNYYFNGFINFTLSLNFIDATDGSLLGTLNGFRDQGYINATYPMDESIFALSRTSFGDNYLLPNTEVNMREVASSSDLVSNDFPEISSYAPVLIREKMIGAHEVLVYATQSKTNQLLLYAYDKESGDLLGTTHVGQTNPYEIGDLYFTEDDGMVVLAKTYVAKRFPRIALFKFSKEEVDHLIQ